MMFFITFEKANVSFSIITFEGVKETETMVSLSSSNTDLPDGETD